MEKLSLNLPTMYGDHHVTEVRRILLETPGIEDVYASSCFQIVEISYDAGQIDAGKIQEILEDAGYSEDFPIPLEAGVAAYGQESGNGQTFFRHTAAYEQTSSTVGFAQQVGYSGRPLWPCPGMGVIERAMEMEEE
jgi:copper chaperone CopZ